MPRTETGCRAFAGTVTRITEKPTTHKPCRGYPLQPGRSVTRRWPKNTFPAGCNREGFLATPDEPNRPAG